MVDLHGMFRDINKVSELGNHSGFGAVAIPHYPHFHIAKDSHGLPAVLISARVTSDKKNAPSITLEHIRVHFDVLCRITNMDGITQERVFTVIRCTSKEKSFPTYFLHVTRIMLDLLPEEPTKAQVSKAIGILVELFQTVESPSRKSIQGLWAELFLIDAASQPEILIAAWHITPQDRYDFSIGDERLEVKSSSRPVRQHHFSLEQVTPLEGTQVLIASVFTEAISNGVTIMHLVDRIRTKIVAFPELVAQLDRVVLATLGENWQSAFEHSFDKQLAHATLNFYELSSVPTIYLPLPNGVSEVHFKSDLSRCEPCDPTSLAKRGKLFSSLPKRKSF